MAWRATTGQKRTLEKAKVGGQSPRDYSAAASEESVHVGVLYTLGFQEVHRPKSNCEAHSKELSD